MNFTQLEFEQRASGQSQNALVLERLKATPGEWVSMRELERVSGSRRMNSRIAELRKRGAKEGFSIGPARTEHVDGQVRSFYRLEWDGDGRGA